MVALVGAFVTGYSQVSAEVLGPGELLLSRMNATFAQFDLFIVSIINFSSEHS